MPSERPDPIPTPRRRFMARTLRQSLVVCALAGGFLGALVATGRLDVPPRYDPFAPLNLTMPDAWFRDFRAARARTNPDLCRRSLDVSQVSFRPVPDRVQTNGCNLVAAVEIGPDETHLSSRVTATCGLMTSWLRFERETLQPLARARFGQDLKEAVHLGAYACRPIFGHADGLSQHATANAIDIAGFVLADGMRISVLADWGRDDAKGAFLRAARDGACGLFNVVLSPAYNAAHANHFHLDNGPARACR